MTLIDLYYSIVDQQVGVGIWKFLNQVWLCITLPHQCQHISRHLRLIHVGPAGLHEGNGYQADQRKQNTCEDAPKCSNGLYLTSDRSESHKSRDQGNDTSHCHQPSNRLK